MKNKFTTMLKTKLGNKILTLSKVRCFFSVGTAAEQATRTTSSSSNRLWTLDILQQISVEKILKMQCFILVTPSLYINTYNLLVPL